MLMLTNNWKSTQTWSMMMNKRRKEFDPKRGSKTSSSLMATENPGQVLQFMKTSFYLPVDILKNGNWHVMPIKVITGDEFKRQWFRDIGADREIHCVESPDLLFASNYVAVSQRYCHPTGKTYYVCKLWYGEAP